MFKIIIIISLLALVRTDIFCNYFPLNPKACIKQTDGIMCQFSLFENACLAVDQTNYGCVNNLNKKACLHQLSNQAQLEAKCYFRSKCIATRPAHLKNLGCSPDFSRFACTNVQNKNCIWESNQCQEYSILPKTASSCASVYNNPVTSSLCSLIPQVRCMSGGFKGNYECIDVTDADLFTLNCTQPGLNELGCVLILTTDQKCIFKDSICQNFIATKSDSCELKVNKWACLSLSGGSSVCQWTKRGCEIYEIPLETECESLVNVNSKACKAIGGLCIYNPTSKSCYKPTKNAKITCDTEGISEETCMSLDMPCTYYYNQCQSIQSVDYDQYTCEMKLNRKACINMTGRYQFCQWDGTKCNSILINQDTDCISLLNVNGNVCQQVIKQVCMYDTTNFKCILSKTNDSCSSSYINLLGCVSILKTSYVCQWTSTGCKSINIVKYQTKCKDLGFANPVACSLILEDNLGCYFQDQTKQCTEFKVDTNIGCKTLGLNQNGCSYVTKLDEICRWYRGECVKIANKIDVRQVNCISFQSVNAAACALIEANSESCKFNSLVNSCVASVDGKKDSCVTPGLNSHGCAKITNDGMSCIYDTVKWRCKSLDLAAEQLSEDTKNLLFTATCTGNSPTILVCASITNYLQKCAWSDRLQKCAAQYVALNKTCLDFNQAYMDSQIPGTKITVNANVCAAVEMNFPDHDKLDNTLDVDRGYCSYQKDTHNCIKLGTLVCGDKCCTTEIGINAHSCSRFSDQNTFCYFNKNQRCTELTAGEIDITSQTLVANFFNSNRYPCSSVNKMACHLIEWSTTQWCFYNGLTSCVNINFGDYTDLSVFSGNNVITNRYACMAIEAVSSSKNSAMYFSYDEPNKKCKQFNSSNSITCSETNINLNACTKLTKDDYCMWDRNILQCSFIDDIKTISSCTMLVNQKTCQDLNDYPCLFLNSTDKCKEATDGLIDCNGYDSLGTVSLKACSIITKDGKSCRYDSDTHLCVTHNQNVSTCDVSGANSIACYNYTQANCRWNPITLLCYQISDEAEIQTLGCEDYVNKFICLKLTKEPCEWDSTKMKCLKVTDFSSTTYASKNSNLLHNPQTCTQLVGASYVYNANKNRCVSPPSNSINCNAYPMNAQSCLTSTRSYMCYYDNTKLPSQKCSTFTDPQSGCQGTLIVNLEVCSRIQASCVYDPATWQCKPAAVDNTTKCSSMKGGSIFYNIYSCASVSQTVTDLQATQICVDVNTNQSCSFEKYCFWDPATYTCDVLVIGVSDTTPIKGKPKTGCTDSNGDSVPCPPPPDIPNCIPVKKTYNICKNTYSKAICLEVVSANCFFDLAQGGCNDINSKEKTVPACSNANYQSCLQVTNPLAQCTQGSAGDFTPNCNIEMATQVCITYSGIGVACNSLGSTVNSSVCATASDACYFNGSSCSSSVSSTSCDTLGLSSTSCTSLGAKCKFENNLCQYAAEPVIPSTCGEVDSSSEDAGRKPLICSKVADKCQYSGGSTCTQLSDPITCSSLGTDYVTIGACLACTGGAYQYANSKCSSVSATTYQCLNLNKEACISSTDLVYCIWKDNICQEAGLIAVYSMTDCALVNLVACNYVNNNCWQKGESCNTSDPNTQCANISKDVGNTLACSKSTNENCYWNETDNVCDKVSSSITYGCTQLGLNVNSCLENTFDDTNSDYFYQCYFNGNTCNLFNPQINSDQDCANLNKYACLSITGKLCGWKNSEKRCKKVTLSNVDCVSYSNEWVDFCNALTCSSIVSNQQCYQSANTCAAIDADKSSCTEPGLNRLACLQRTLSKCQFIDMNCQIMNDSSLGCLNTLNRYACANQVAQCKFEGTCQTYDNTVLLDKAGVISILTTGFIQYSPQVCATIKIASTYLAYNSKTSMCNDVENVFQICGAIGINKLACLEKTKQLCKYDADSCQQMTRTEIMSLKACDPTLNWYSCITQTVDGGCKFMNGLCQPIVPSTDNCQALITQHSKVKQSICSTLTDKVCLYNSITNECETSILTNLACVTPGLNKEGCINNTSTDICLFDSTKSICQIYMNNDVSCDSQINSLKCYYVEVKNNFCYFDSGACKSIPSNDLLTCVKAYKHNPATCSQATDVACYYDQATYKCVSRAPTIECSGNVSVNQLGCIACTTNSAKLKWNNGCNSIAEGELSIASCSDPLNQFACTNITNPSQFCQFKLGSCQSVDSTTIEGNCINRTNVNRLEYCESATDVPCFFNKDTRNCEELTANVVGCPRGLNQKACSTYGSYKVSGDGNCKFQNFCFSPDDIIFCNQATNQQDCLNITTDSCEYDGSKCISIDTTTLKCTDLTDSGRLFSEMACNKSQSDNALKVCVQDRGTSQCKSIQPTTCDEIKDQVSCTNILDIPCIWANKLCSFHLTDPMVDTCGSVNTLGSQRTCLDVRRVGYYCYFSDFQCITVPTTVTSCDRNVNYVACLMQKNYACQWKIEESTIKKETGGDDYIYQKGICSDYEEKGQQGCSDTLSLISCMMVTKPGAQCIWIDHKCQQIVRVPSVVTQRTYSIINKNACGLVTSGIVEYNPIIYGCRQASDTRNCITPGLNKDACISIKQFKCLWNSELKQCQNYKSTRRILANNTDQCHKNSETINEQICQQISLYVPCGYDEGNCVTLNSTAQCGDDGVNFYGCMTITTTPCIWIVDHCEEYYPFGTCSEVPQLVNSLVCANVDEDECQFDANHFKCVPLDNQTNCNITGINSIGCAQKDGCIFLNGKCQLPEGNIACSTAISANQNVCAQAIDRCKYNDISYGCTQSTVIDSCFTPGLSALGCNVLEQCTMSNDSCQCLAYVRRFPTCTDVLEYSTCTSLPYCFFELTKVTSTKDLTEFLKNSNAGLCRNKLCSDLLNTQCDGQYIDKTICYLNKDYKCVSANTCDEIIKPINECFNYKLQNTLCVFVPNQCTTLDCKSLNGFLCTNHYKEYCVYDNNNCSQRTCDQMSKEQCLANTCDYDEITEKCSNQISCSLVTNSTKCIGKKQNHRQCGWITLTNQQEVCSVNGCRYMGKTQGTCIGTHISDEVCVQLSDFSCVACEEITDACVCFQHPQYCTFDRLQAKCVSLSCNGYTKDQCPSTCRYLEEINVCTTKCEANYNQEVCGNSNNCKWDKSNQLCVYSEPVTIIEKIILPTPTNGLLLTIGLIGIMNL